MADNPPADLANLLTLGTVRDSTSRELFLAVLREYGGEGKEYSPQRLDVLMRAEEHFQTLLRADQSEFLRAPVPSEVQRDFALGVQRVYLDAANGFQRFLRSRQSWAVEGNGAERLCRVTGLALHAIHGFIKWGRFIDDAAAVKPWKPMHALYLLAESEDYGSALFAPYPSQGDFTTTVQALYLRALLLDLVDHRFTKVEIEIADGWLASWCGDYSLESEYSARHHNYCVDLSSAGALHEIGKASRGNSIRFLHVKGVKKRIEALRAGLAAGRTEAIDGGGSAFTVGEHADLLARVESHPCFKAGSEDRREERSRFRDQRVDVTLGTERLLRQVRESPAISSLKLSLVTREGASEAGAAQRDIECWRLHDLSARAYGLIASPEQAQLVPVNGLLGIRNQDTNGWFACAVVRKVPSGSAVDVLVGLEVLSYRPVAVELAATGGASAHALYLPSAEGKSDSLILREADFNAEQSYVLATSGSRYRIRLNEVVRKGEGWVLARFATQSRA